MNTDRPWGWVNRALAFVAAILFVLAAVNFSPGNVHLGWAGAAVLAGAFVI